ncbi:succinate dehydrogenase / fumarate reductase flavoprotein subunit [Pseudonocardia sediminis]|uniref:Succinate dehydrogenase / fumarate reductase flavoprotein subunit n=2 Tax=Pseudonocardia sediminis TaxID=1397368 RepID=A0A4Q7UY03_PSEST|nr:succinate dehydrogenase / fumarate reductase flavoprotein subunit [Pseudonocardia sediminis]
MEQRSATNVLVIGAGAGGLRASIELAEQGVEVLCVGKRRRDDAHTTLAAGGINAALGTMDPEDSWAQHAADTLREGYWLSDPEAVEYLAQHSPEAIAELVEWGAQFAREDDGRLSQRFFGAHKWRRTCFAGDYTGRIIQQTLLARAQQLEVPFRDDLYISRLLVHDNRVFGAYGFDIQTGRRHLIFADAVVLAAGGHTRIWRRSSSRRDENTGDAMRLASMAGARLQDMELVQFHPTGMVYPDGAEGTLVTEAVRGEGGRLVNANGERFMERYDPERRELSTRDRVALANHTEIAEGRGTEHGGVWLDVTHLDREHILERLPRMYRQFIDLVMLDITREPMEVAPTAHYSMGGVRVDPETHASDVEGLYAVGECASGVHGANRLGGNSLGECVVFGRTVGREAARFSAEVDVHVRDRAAIDAARAEIDGLLGDGSATDDFPRPLQRAVRDLMSTWCGVVRDETGLRRGLAELDDLETRAASITVRADISGYDDLAHALDLRGSLLAARATLDCALARTETRGAHVRSDHPDLDPAQVHNLLWTPDGVTTRPVGTASPEVLDLVDASGELTTAGRLLE